MRAVFDALRAHAQTRPDATAIREGERSITWSELAASVARAAAGFAAGPPTVGLRLSGIDYAIADLGASLAGRRVVPVPGFFSDSQIAHLIEDAGARLITTLPAGDRPMALDYAGGASRVIYTSGTTGRPKGVVLGDRQIAASLAGLMAALRPHPGDRYLSVLPQAQLLEQVCGLFLPVLAGAPTIISREGAASLFTGDGRGLALAAARSEATVTVLAPRQLTLWVAELRRGAPLPKSLRYVAVGGAPVAPALLAEARALGLPVAEGYGLSEACSVVALTPAGASAGSAMQVLDGVDLWIEDGEIVVDGPTVMQAYLHRNDQVGPWRTGDLGRMRDGRIEVLGRRDAMILRQSGRNIAPEWVEAEALADPAIPAAALVQTPADQLILVAAALAAPDMVGLSARLAALPAYARPDHLAIVDPRTPGLIRGSGTADRRVAAELAAAAAPSWIALSYPEHGEAVA